MKKVLLSLLVAFAAVATASAYDFISGGLAYNINDDGTSVRVTYIQRPIYLGWDEVTELDMIQPTYPNLSGAVTIPPTVMNNGTNYTVTGIENEAFHACLGLTSITIPASVTSIERNPFMYCDALTSITVAEGNTVYDTRDNCNTIVTKQAVTVQTHIYNTTAGGGYTIYTIPESYLKDQVVAGCNSSTIPSSVTSVGAHGFEQCRMLASMVVPEGVTRIEKNAFTGCGALQTLTLPSTLTYIGNTAFDGLFSLTDVYGYFNPENVTLVGNAVWQQTLLNPEWNHAVNLHVYPQYVQWFQNEYQNINSSPWASDGWGFNVIGDIGVELYLAGSFNGWANGKVPFTMGNDGKWTITQAMEAGAEFKLIRILEGQDGMTWIGGSGAQITQEQVENGEEISLLIGYGSNFQIPVAGTWTLSVDLDNAKMVISGEWNEQVIDPAMYIIGTFNNWDQNTQEAMTAGENNTWTITKTLEAASEFKFRDELGTWYGGQDDNNVGYFEIKKEMVTGNTPITMVDGANFMIPVAGTWTFTVTRGDTMTLVVSGDWDDPQQPVTGDVTGDGTVDIDDVNAVINIILKVKTEEDYPGVADLNNDGQVDVDDMNIVINIILTQNN